MQLDLFSAWKNRKWWTFSPFGIAAVACLGYFYLVPSQWETSVIVQIGQVGQQAIGAQTQLVESGPRVYERIKSRSFKDGILKSLDMMPAGDAPFSKEARIFNNSLSVKLLSNPDLVELKVRGLSPERTDLILRTVVAKLKSLHQAIASPTLERIATSLRLVQSEIARLEPLRNEYKSRALKEQNIGKVENFLQSSLYVSLLDSLERDQRSLLERKASLEEQLASARTYSTSALDDFVTSREPVAPSRLLAIVACLFVAGLFSALILLASANRLEKA